MNPVHLVRIAIDAQRLATFARRSRVPLREMDSGYAVHAALAAVFDHGAAPGDHVAPKPFSIANETTRTVDVLGYAPIDGAALVQRARAFADPMATDVCDLSRVDSRPMPLFERGARVGFRVRICPVRRVAKRGNQEKHRAEVDAFLAKVWEVNDASVSLDREEVYRTFLEEELRKAGAASLEAAKLTSFQLSRLHRRAGAPGERRGRQVNHPEALFEGVLRVEDPEAFADRLARGLGRHRAFGFGMLLLRPAPAVPRT